MSLRIKKMDLHVHTPASHDFVDKAATAREIVEHAISEGLDGIGVTDHNTVDFIDQIQSAAACTALTIFPGIEISCGGARDGSVHVIALFDPSRTKSELERVVGRLEIRGSGETSLTNKSVNDVVDIISNEGGLPVLAHANSTHGALNDIRGNPRIEVVKNKHLLAVEATGGDFARTDGKRLIDLLDGKDPVYKRKLAVYQSSDNPAPGGHQVKTIGSSFSYFKMGEMSITSLRQCFEDPDARIIQKDDSSKLNDSHPRINAISIDGGFLKGQKVEFSGSMNSIIGGTGTGKSLLIEFIRFALNKPPTLEPILKDHKEKLVKQLGIHSAVTLHIQDGSGEQYEIKRELSSARDPYSSPIECTNKTTSSDFRGDVNSIFSTLIYSQNEILEITRDPRAQLELLENFRDFGKYKTKSADLVRRLKDLDLELIRDLTGCAIIDSLEKELSTIKEQLKKAVRGLKGKVDDRILERYNELKNEKEALTCELEGYVELEETLAGGLENAETQFASRKMELDKPSALAKEIFGEVNKAWKISIENIRNSQKVVERSKADSEKKIIAWEKQVKFADADNAYKAEIKKKGVLQEKEATRQELASKERTCQAKLDKAKRALEACAKTKERRKKLLEELSNTLAEHSQDRDQQAKLITSRSGGKLQITLKSQSDTSNFAQALMKLKVGSRAEKAEIENLTKKISAIALVDLVLDGNFAKMSKETGLSEQMVQNVVAELKRPENLSQTLALQYERQGEDQIEIEYLKKDGKYYPLGELSMGQKADALIMIALGDGSAPVIIDQPEDALDIPSIWTDICTRIRPIKHERQFLFTTHNSSISVASDSDQFTVLEADGSSGWVARTGSIDQKAIRDDIVSHLEGGYDSYDLKRRKYGL